MEVKGWRLYQYKLFSDELDRLIAEVERLRLSQPDNYKQHPITKRLAKIRELVLSEIPEDPSHERWLQGNTLGSDHRMWRRAKFGQNRFRLFFRYDSSAKVIIYAWVNSEKTLRKEGDKNDPYTHFQRSLRKGDPPRPVKQASLTAQPTSKESSDTNIKTTATTVKPHSNNSTESAIYTESQRIPSRVNPVENTGTKSIPSARTLAPESRVASAGGTGGDSQGPTSRAELSIANPSQKDLKVQDFSGVSGNRSVEFDPIVIETDMSQICVTSM